MANKSTEKVNETENFNKMAISPGFEHRVFEAFGLDSIKDVAEELGENYHTVRNYLQLRREIPSSILMKIANLTNFSLNWLLFEQGGKKIEKTATSDPDNFLSDEKLDQIHELLDADLIDISDAKGKGGGILGYHIEAVIYKMVRQEVERQINQILVEKLKNGTILGIRVVDQEEDTVDQISHKAGNVEPNLGNDAQTRKRRKG